MTDGVIQLKTENGPKGEDEPPAAAEQGGRGFAGADEWKKMPGTIWMTASTFWRAQQPLTAE